MKIFSCQKTYENTEFKDACASFFFIYSVSKICLNVVNFPAKNTVLRIRMRRFF